MVHRRCHAYVKPLPAVSRLDNENVQGKMIQVKISALIKNIGWWGAVPAVLAAFLILGFKVMEQSFNATTARVLLIIAVWYTVGIVGYGFGLNKYYRLKLTTRQVSTVLFVTGLLSIVFVSAAAYLWLFPGGEYRNPGGPGGLFGSILLALLSLWLSFSASISVLARLSWKRFGVVLLITGAILGLWTFLLLFLFMGGFQPGI
ncbi:MAG: hypothetical protein H0Z39_04960 [Peptococcaceae bacterium]|nr:hypothetical protein [Peptococcaceae bacterium]